MNYDQLFAQMNTEVSSEVRNDVVSFLRHCLVELKANQYSTTDIAYDMAGLMATDYIKSLATDDPIHHILTIAGELEIKPPNADTLRNELIATIEQL